jgi:acetyl-CoA/propionyl-CoA carboxylase biotin carboxyl carrier protein
MEVNPRLQVEHPVTEEVTGVDLVLQQFRIAAGVPLDLADPPAHGHAIEFRINAEDAANGFLPSPGTVARLRLPGGPGVRCDFGYEAGDALTGAFDSLAGKVVVRGRDRAEAIARSRRALGELVLEGFTTLRDFHRAVLDAPEFTAVDGGGFKIHTRWVEEDFAGVQTGAADGAGTGAGGGGGVPATSRMVVEVDGKRLEVVLPAELTAGPPPAAPMVPRRTARRQGGSTVGASTDGAVVAPMQGTVVRVAVAEGDRVEAGDLLAVLEAMKMEQPLTAPRAGSVQGLGVRPGDRVPTGHVLCVIQPH